MVKATTKESIKQTAFKQLKVIGFFDPEDAASQEQELPPEIGIDLNAVYESGKRKDVAWKHWDRGEDLFLPVGKLFSGNGGVGYALSYVYCRRPSKAVLTGCPQCIEKILVNKEAVYEKTSDTGELKVNLNLRRGYSEVLIRFSSSKESPADFWAGVTEADGTPATNFAMTDNGIVIDRIGYHWKTAVHESGPVEPIPDLLVMSNLNMFHGKSPYDDSPYLEVGDPETEWKRSNPDIVVYKPKEGDRFDGDNEHFLVFEAPSGDLLAMWTQGVAEPTGDNHTMLARSKDGINWAEPKQIVGTTWGTRDTQASWAFPVVSKSGRMYCIYAKQKAYFPGGHSGIMGRLCSDDDGETWTEGADLIFPNMYEVPDDPTSKMISLAIVWQKPFRDSRGRLMAGYSDAGRDYTGFMRFENIDEGPLPEDMEITWLPKDGQLLKLPKWMYQFPDMAVEPSVVLLPDGRLFATFVNFTGYIWYSVSDDDGESWRELEVLKTNSTGRGEPLKQTTTNCPIYQLDDGRYILIYQNNTIIASAQLSGVKMPWGMWSYSQRRPAYIAVGEYKPDEHQPIWFSEAKLFLDNKGVIVSLKGTNEIGNYGSFTSYKGRQVYWYPDRKHYLLGKIIDDELLEGMTAEYLL